MLKQLPRETVGAPYLEVLKARLDGAMGSLIEWVATSPWRGGGGHGAQWSSRTPPRGVLQGPVLNSFFSVVPSAYTAVRPVYFSLAPTPTH